MKLLAALAASISILAAQDSPGPVRTVTAVRCWSVGEVTRVAIEVTGDFEIRSDRLHNPERVYYDILRSRPMIESRRIYSRSLDDKLVKRIRVAETLPGITRVVLDLNGDAEPAASKLTNPTRLIVELRAASAAHGHQRAGSTARDAFDPPGSAQARIAPPDENFIQSADAGRSSGERGGRTLEGAIGQDGYSRGGGGAESPAATARARAGRHRAR